MQISKSQLRQRGEGHGDTVDVENDPEMLALTAEIDEKVQKSEAEGEEGNVDESMALLEQAEALRQKKAALQTARIREITGGLGDKQQLRVCNVCGAKLSSRDSDECVACPLICAAGRRHEASLPLTCSQSTCRALCREGSSRVLHDPPETQGAAGEDGHHAPPQRAIHSLSEQ